MPKPPNITNNNSTLNSSKTFRVANQTEVSILHYVTLTSITTMDDISRQFIIPFAVAYIRYYILGTPFFEEYIPNINIRDFTLQFKHHSKEFPNHTKFTSLLSKDYPYFSYLHRINSNTQIRLKDCSFSYRKLLHPSFHYNTKSQFFPKVFDTYFSTKFSTTFSFIETFTNDKPDKCATIIQKPTNHVATLLTGTIGYIEVLITIEKP